MQKSQIDKIVYTLCATSQGASNSKLAPNLLLLLEAVSINSEYEESINRLLQQYYSGDHYTQQLRELSRIAFRKLFSGKSYSYREANEVCRNLLGELGFNNGSFVEQQKLYKFIYDGYLSIQYRPSPELIKKLCKYLGLESSRYLPCLEPYGSYMARRRRILLGILESEPVIEPSFNYMGKVREMKEILFTKLVQFVEKVFDDSWSNSIDTEGLCNDTQELMTEFRELQKAEAATEQNHNVADNWKNKAAI